MLDETLRRSSYTGLRSACAQHGWMQPKARLAIASLLSLVLAPVSLLAQALVVEKVTVPTTLTPISVHSFGRTKLDADGMYTFQWPGVYFTLAYEAPALYFRVGRGKQNLHILVDSQTRDIVTDGQPAVYRISAPAGQTHVVRIDVVNESASAAESLGGFAVSVGGKGIDFAIDSRQIEFIGDSHTVGYGNTSTSRECTGLRYCATRYEYETNTITIGYCIAYCMAPIMAPIIRSMRSLVVGWYAIMTASQPIRFLSHIDISCWTSKDNYEDSRLETAGNCNQVLGTEMTSATAPYIRQSPGRGRERSCTLPMKALMPISYCNFVCATQRHSLSFWSSERGGDCLRREEGRADTPQFGRFTYRFRRSLRIGVRSLPLAPLCC